MAQSSALAPLLASALQCNDKLDGMCVYPEGSRGVVVYYEWQGCSESFINLPGINLLPRWFLGVMWGLFLMWTFFGVAVISDAFVEAIEVITSKTRMYKRKDTKGNIVYVEEPVWNWAVANITLLALGTSSPEILLSLVECLLTLGKEAGELGPSCIVGSASYNLFGIIAVCTISLPVGVFKKIEHEKVFMWTTTWSLWAYLWLWLVYKRISPGEVEVWEAFLTLGFTPIFVWTTWLVDTRGWNWLGPHKNAVVPALPDPEDSTTQDSEDVSKDIELATPSTPTKALQTGGSAVTLAHPLGSPFHSILYYRQLAVQQMAGCGTAVREAAQEDAEHTEGLSPKSAAHAKYLDLEAVESMDKSIPKVLFTCPELSVLESSGMAYIQVMRMHGDPNSTLLVRYACKDETAVAGLDYQPVEGTLVFGPGQSTQDVRVKILDDDMSEPDVAFGVEILGAEMQGGGEVMVLRQRVDVTIVDDDDGGVISFELPTWEAGADDKMAYVTVVRRSGADGRVTVDYATKDGTAVAGTHFRKIEGTLVFNAGETRQQILVPLVEVSGDHVVTGNLAFRLALSNPLGGAALGRRTECRVVVVPGSQDRVALKQTTSGEGALASDAGDGEFDLAQAWENRFREAILPEYDEDEDTNVWLSMCLHYISITYKLLVACLPPPEWKSGYPCFFLSLALLAGLIAIVVEVANMFGCAIGLSELMTGMTVVAMGTSLPDTFASRMAAIKDDTADAAIGNVMGSNCINVFLGLGIPWIIASLYYLARDSPYAVQDRSLGFIIMIFFILAVACLVIVRFRRWQGGELGGGRVGQWVTTVMLFGIWLLFMILAGLYDYNHIKSVGF